MASLYVRKIATGEIVHTIALSDASPRRAERVLRGLLMNMDRNTYYVDDSEVGAVPAGAVQE